MKTDIAQRKVGLAVALLLGASGACSRDNSASTTKITSAAPVSERTVDQIAQARCDREGSCDNIGDGKAYANQKACLNDIRGKGFNDFTATTCPNGIDSSQLQKCLAEIRGERCGSPIDTISRINSCRTEALCPK